MSHDLGGGPLFRVGDGHHPAWERISDDAAMMAFLVDDKADADELAERSGLSRSVALFALAELMEAGLVSTAPPVRAVPQKRRWWPWAAALGATMVLLATAVVAYGGGRREAQAPPRADVVSVVPAVSAPVA